MSGCSTEVSKNYWPSTSMKVVYTFVTVGPVANEHNTVNKVLSEVAQEKWAQAISLV